MSELDRYLKFSIQPQKKMRPFLVLLLRQSIWFTLTLKFLYYFSGYLSLMDDTGATRDDLKVPEGDVGDECNNATAEGRDIMVSYL